MSLDPDTWKQQSGHRHFYNYFKRLVRLQHLEFDNALQQILWILFHPKKV